MERINFERLEFFEKRINEILIEKYEIKYSTIVVFNGAEYEIKASNVDEMHWDALKSLQDVDMFKDSIAQATPKYVTVNNDQERLPYQKMEFGRAKSAIFFPLYIDNVYIGYWIIESGTPHDFDNVDTTVLEVIKDNIVSVLKTVGHQKTIESIVRKDLFSGLYSEEYLYGEGKKIIDQYTTSTICMYKIINLEEINHKYCRELGNKVIEKTSEYIKQNISTQYVYVRYMGPKFVIAFSGVELNGVAEFINELKEKLEKVVTSDFVRIDHKDVIDLLKNSGEKWEFEPEYDEDIAKEHERWLTNHFSVPVFVKNWPKDIKAYYMKLNSDGKTVAGVDLEVPGAGELIGGSQREENLDVLLKRMEETGADRSSIEWYINLRRYGGCVHSGFGMGFERLIMYLTGMENIRDVIPYPRTPGSCEF